MNFLTDEPDYFYYDPAEWQGGQPDWEIDDWYPEYDDYEEYDDEEYTAWTESDYDADDEGWPYPDEDDETEAPF